MGKKSDNSKMVISTFVLKGAKNRCFIVESVQNRKNEIVRAYSEECETIMENAQKRWYNILYG